MSKGSPKDVIKGAETLRIISSIREAIAPMSPIDVINNEWSSWIGQLGPLVTLNQPASITLCEKGGYSKVPMIGGEEFRLVGARPGKTDLIVLAKVESTTGLGSYRAAATYEFKSKDAERLLDGYVDVLADTLGKFGLTDDEKERQRIKKEADLIEEQARAEAILKARHSDHRFGSW